VVQVTDAVGRWHDFYMLIGSASATLIGLLFVAVSVGSTVFTAEKQHGLRTFLSPNVFHFTSVLAACLIGVAPTGNWATFATLIGCDGLFGLAYAGAVWRRMVRHGLSSRIGIEDRVWYAALPAVGYAIMIAAGAILLLQSDAGCGVLALAMGMLLLAGIRNAWDMTTWVVVRRRD
jgi:hypothetical protein